LYDHLSTIAEVGIGLAGFASLATVLRSQSQSEAVVALQRLLVLLVLSFSVVFLSFLPPILAGVGLSDGAAWRSSAGALCVLVGFLLSPLSPLQRNLRRVRESGYPRPELRRDWSFYSLLLGGILALTVALGLLPSRAGAVFLAALALLLVTAAAQFVRLMVSLVGER
jgi:hypothetical protein